MLAKAKECAAAAHPRDNLPSLRDAACLAHWGSGFTAGTASFSPSSCGSLQSALPSLDLVLSEEGWTEGLAEKFLGPLSGFDGFDEDARLWWPFDL